jgi:hypothetical protein
LTTGNDAKDALDRITITHNGLDRIAPKPRAVRRRRFAAEQSGEAIRNSQIPKRRGTYR